MNNCKEHCECVKCTHERRLLRYIPKISDELAKKYGKIADKWHKQLYQKEIYPPINNDEA